MMLYRMLAEGVVCLELSSGDLRGALAELLRLLAPEAVAGDVQAALAEMGERAALAGVAGDSEFVILPAVTPQAERLGLAFGRSPAGLASRSISGPPVHFVCVLVIPSSERSRGFRALNALAVLLRDPMVRTQLLWAEAVEDALAVFREAEGGRRWAAQAWLGERIGALLGGGESAAGSTSGESA